MPKYIDTMDAITELKKDFDGEECLKAIRAIQRAKAADVQEVNHGKWVRPDDATRSSYKYQCSLCGEVAYQVTGNCGRKVKVEKPDCTYRFCPNCGARMDL